MIIRANAVEVTKLFRADCRIIGCEWKSDLYTSYQGANGARQDHLGEHRLEEEVRSIDAVPGV